MNAHPPATSIRSHQTGVPRWKHQVRMAVVVIHMAANPNAASHLFVFWRMGAFLWLSRAVASPSSGRARIMGGMQDVILAMAEYERAADQRANFCRICWGPLNECPGHQGYIEMFGPPPSPEQVEAYRADLEVRQRGLERKHCALEAAARQLGYESLEDLAEKVCGR